jgi:D-alanine-D-alanine ligase
MSKPSVAVIMGGTSFERDFSLKSGKRVCSALEETGHEVLPLDADSNLVDTLRAEKPDVAFVTLHGAGGEDGSVPSLLEFLRIPFVGSRPPVCRASWNKSDIPFVMRRAFSADESVASWPAEVVLPAKAFRDLGAAKALDLVAARVGSGFPLAVKPTCGGSAMGVTKVESEEGLGEAIMAALAFDDSVIIQEWVEGVELSVVVLGDPGDEQVLPPVEIHPTSGLYDTDARLDTSRVEHFCPVRPESLASDPERAESIRSEVERAAIEVFEAFGCRDMARIDMIWDGARACVLDLKVFPGLTDTSLVPMAVSAAGIDFAELVDQMVGVAYERGC